MIRVNRYSGKGASLRLMINSIPYECPSTYAEQYQRNYGTTVGKSHATLKEAGKNFLLAIKMEQKP